ncbi:uncharacterized protein LOC127280380 [Leptopilina boulardi]|uniref:uncharacterized protein LOC127280380 n=1 Tax=Leptopilina boulardi TaxID=63433 RepID=UPI0021F680E8|nr:uncharacterized protein LOC127280380 [Leptopilina boulardi]
MEELIDEQEIAITTITRAERSFRKRPYGEMTAAYVEGRRSELMQAWNNCKALDTLDTFNETIANINTRLIRDSGESSQSRDSIEPHRRIKLPRIDLPKFNGNYLEWQNFKDMFESMIASEHDLADVQKMQYLKSCLEGEAAQLLKHLGTNSSNYASAWELLETRYANQRVIIDSYLNSFISIPPISNETVTDLKLLRDTTIEALHALKNLGHQGSEATFISENVVQLLHAKTHRVLIRVNGVDNVFISNVKAKVNLTIFSRTEPQNSIEISALVLPRLNNYTRLNASSTKQWEHLKNLNFADDNPFITKKYEMIIGADYYGSLLLKGIKKGPNGSPIAQNSLLGWIVSGPTNSLETVPRTLAHQNIEIPELQQDLQRFWEVEECFEKISLTPEEKSCEEYFSNIHSRTTEGRYVVRQIFKDKENQILGSSLAKSLTMLTRSEKRLDKNPSLKNDYYDFLKEYKTLNHMVEIKPDLKDEKQRVYLPHHPIIRESSSTTRVRVVFNASSLTSNGVSLNDLLSAGPKLHTEIPSIILRWRNYRFVMTADICKMFRQILIDPQDQHLQNIVCRLGPDEEIKHFRLLTVTYGTKSAPYLANRVIKQLAADEGEDFPEAKTVLENDFYVDDGLFGGNDLEKTRVLKNDLCKLLARGGFMLYKFSSNAPELLSGHTDIEESKNLDIVETESNCSVLGLVWNSKDDEFRFTVAMQPFSVVTKRLILSVISKLFDPLGLVAPIIIVAKIIMQDLWLQKFQWDSELPEKFKEQWVSYCHKLNSIKSIKIPRWTGCKEGSQIEVHGFADASSRAYAAVVYIRVLNPHKSPILTISLAKTKVAPIKIVTIPRLELCAIVLLTKLLKRVVSDHQLNQTPIYGWTDSTIALSWLAKHPSTWKTFVANRVQTVHTLLPCIKWRHVPSSDNPADCASRGINPSELQENRLWWQGPIWLKEPEASWPSSPVLEYGNRHT